MTTDFRRQKLTTTLYRFPASVAYGQMCMQAHTHLPATKLDSKYKYKNNTTQTGQKWQMLMKNTTFIT